MSEPTRLVASLVQIIAEIAARRATGQPIHQLSLVDAPISDLDVLVASGAAGGRLNGNGASIGTAGVNGNGHHANGNQAGQNGAGDHRERDQQPGEEPAAPLPTD